MKSHYHVLKGRKQRPAGINRCETDWAMRGAALKSGCQCRCLTSRDLLKHHQKCQSQSCPICTPVKQYVQKQRALASSQQGHDPQAQQQFRHPQHFHPQQQGQPQQQQQQHMMREQSLNQVSPLGSLITSLVRQAVCKFTRANKTHREGHS